MEEDTRQGNSRQSIKADHLCVLVHGLWGTPAHLAYIESALQEQYNSQQLIILSTKSNAGYFTYDGIECGGERIAKEIEAALDELARDGHEIRKLSMVGYSLGGLVARYAIGLLYVLGLFETVKPVNFTTFATPHLGVRTPLKSYWNRTWNFIGARTLSTSGRQLFAIDSFRDQGRPILSVLADPQSIFMKALSKFERRSLYSNIVNDRSAPHYTTAISAIDPFTEMDKVNISFVPGYAPIILDSKSSVRLKNHNESPSFSSRLASGSRALVSGLPLYAALAVLIPFGIAFFFINAGVQTTRSKRRIRLHEDDDKLDFRVYRVPLMVRQAVEGAFENVNAAQGQQYLLDGSEEMANGPTDPSNASSESLPYSLQDQSAKSITASEKCVHSSQILAGAEQSLDVESPPLALTPAQFAMVKALDDVGFKKYYVWIHQSRHSHAAMIVRTKKESFAEGKVVIKHWLQEDFLI